MRFFVSRKNRDIVTPLPRFVVCIHLLFDKYPSIYQPSKTSILLHFFLIQVKFSQVKCYMNDWNQK